MRNIDPVAILFWFIVFVFSLSVHESAHAWVSDRFGDDTGKLLGRISLNPIVHVDLWGTILFPLMSVFTGIPLFGWAKPVPVNPLNWREKNKANFWVSAAGPLSNFALAIVFFVVLKGLLLAILSGALGISSNTAMAVFSAAGNPYDRPESDSMLVPAVMILSFGLFVNVSLAIFNLIPVPPLDGSGVVESMLPYEGQQAYAQIRPYGFLLLYGLMILGVFSFIFGPVFRVIHFLLWL